jgi:pimeloyl-ACP methyl ester carboxylesterase
MRKMLIACSIWEPVKRPAAALPCIIYMHGNSSGRVEAIPQLALALALGATFFAFDFSGSGLSEGEYVSLGHFEKDDLQCVVEYLRGTSKTSGVALWGRSMGAATALMYTARDPSIAGMILDSSFADLTLLAEGMVDKGREAGYTVPSFAVKLAIRSALVHFDMLIGLIWLYV